MPTPTSLAPSPPSAARGYLIIHLSVLLFGFTPIMGRLITLDALPLVWWRMLIAALALLCVPATWRGMRQLSRRTLLACCGAGVVLSTSWTLFYLSVKLTNASVAAVCLGTAPLFVAIFGPALMHRPWKRSDLILGAAVIPGIMLVVGGIPHGMYLGLGVGLLSAAVLVVFSGINKMLANRVHPLSATCLEMATGALFLAIVAALLPQGTETVLSIPQRHDLVLLLAFGVLLTAVPITTMLVSLRTISVFAQQMAVNLEPVYAVLLAIPILGEQQQLDALFYLGVVLIVGTVMIEPALRWFGGGHRRRTAVSRPESVKKSDR